MWCEFCGHEWHGLPCTHKTIKTALGGKRIVVCVCESSLREKR